MTDIFDLFKKIEKKSEASEPISYIVAGLGNPGTKYARTRHNAGFTAIGVMEKKLGFKADRLKFSAYVGETKIAGRRTLVMMPQTFMNLSGDAIAQAASFYDIPASNIIVVFDDISLEPGGMRIRRNGSAGGHNGIKSIIERLGTSDFPRIKLGVGNKPEGYDLADWVLGNLGSDDEKKLLSCAEDVIPALEKIIGGDIEGAMCLYNRKGENK